MNTLERLNNYINDNTYRITIKERIIHIINFLEIIDFANNEVIIKHEKGLTIIEGEDLVINKIMDQEVLITGCIKRLKL